MRAPVRAMAAVAAAGLAVGSWMVARQPAHAHCDTMDGPVVKAARQALARGDIAPVLKWVKSDTEPEVRAAFQQTLAVRGQSPTAKELADRYFFETLVRLHRAGEGAPYTGLKPSGTKVEPAIAAADRALETGSPDALVTLVTEDAARGIRERFARAASARKHADESVEAGREYVEAYVAFTHYVERLHADAAGRPPEHEAHAERAGHAEPAGHAAHGENAGRP